MIRFSFSIGFLFCILLFLSCEKGKDKKETLELAESIIDIHPDSSLHLLTNIPMPEKMSKRNYAKYALLVTKAKDKQYIRHTTDSLINIAVDYYANDRNHKYKAEAYFYLGSVYRDMGYSTLCIDAFLKSLETIPQDNEDRLMMLIYDNLAAQYEKQEFYDKALEMAKKSYDCCIKKEENNDIFYAQRRISGLFLQINNVDSAFYYINKALETANSKKDSLWQSMVFCDISRIYNETKDFETAYHNINKSIEIRNQYPSNSILFLKGAILSELGQIDSARHYLLESSNSQDINFKAISFRRLYNIEKEEKNFEKAIIFNDNYMIFKDSINMQKKRIEISALMNEHALNIRMKNHFIKQQKQEFALLILSITTLCMGSLLILLLKKRKREHIIFLQRELMRNRVSNLQLNTNIQEIEPAKDTRINLNLFQKKLDICTDLFKTNVHYDIIRKIQKNKRKEKYLSLEDREKLKKNIYENFIDIAEDMKNSFNKLTEADIYCCLLYLLNCDNFVVSICMGVLPDTLKVRRNRIKAKINEEFYNFVFKDLNN